MAREVQLLTSRHYQNRLHVHEHLEQKRTDPRCSTPALCDVDPAHNSYQKASSRNHGVDFSRSLIMVTAVQRTVEAGDNLDILHCEKWPKGMCNDHHSGAVHLHLYINSSTTRHQHSDTAEQSMHDQTCIW